MSLHKGIQRGGWRGRRAGRSQPAVQSTNSTAPVTHADLISMEQRFKIILTEALAQF